MAIKSYTEESKEAINRHFLGFGCGGKGSSNDHTTSKAIGKSSVTAR